MSIYPNIRGGLQERLLEVDSLPQHAGRANVAFEGVKFTPTPRVPYIVAMLVPVSSRVITLGDLTYLHEGTFEIAVVWPLGVKDQVGGTLPAEEVADDIRQAYRLDNSILHNGTAVRLSFAERRAAVIEADWLRIPISIGWFVHDFNT